MDGQRGKDRVPWYRKVRNFVLVLLGALFALQAVFLGYITIEASRLRTGNPSAFSLSRIRQRQTGRPARDIYPVRLDEVPIIFLHTLILAEDPGFTEHAGFDPALIRYALELNRLHGSVVYGGSTLTQQLTRTLFLFPHRFYLRKVLELQAALVLDTVLSKERILELYINYAEWGPGFFGLGAASRHYYRKIPAELTDEEMLALLTILPSPVRFNPFNYRDSPMLEARHDELKELMRLLDSPEQKIRVEIRRISRY